MVEFGDGNGEKYAFQRITTVLPPIESLQIDMAPLKNEGQCSLDHTCLCRHFRACHQVSELSVHQPLCQSAPLQTCAGDFYPSVRPNQLSPLLTRVFLSALIATGNLPPTIHPRNRRNPRARQRASNSDRKPRRYSKGEILQTYSRRGNSHKGNERLHHQCNGRGHRDHRKCDGDWRVDHGHCECDSDGHHHVERDGEVACSGARGLAGCTL